MANSEEPQAQTATSDSTTATSKKPRLKPSATKTIIRRNSNRVYGVFVDGTSLDRASRRIQRRIDMAALLKSLTSGGTVSLARYYTLLPSEDDSRHRSFLDAVSKAGFEVLVKRLPPKGVNRHVAVDVEMAADIVGFALGSESISNLSLVSASGQFSILSPNSSAQSGRESVRYIAPHVSEEPGSVGSEVGIESQSQALEEKSEERSVVVVCPSRELSYPLALCKHFGADTINADFGKFTSGDLLKSAAKWIDLSDSQTIWKS